MTSVIDQSQALSTLTGAHGFHRVPVKAVFDDTKDARTTRPMAGTDLTASSAGISVLQLAQKWARPARFRTRRTFR